MAGLDILNKTITIQDLQKKASSIVNDVSSTQQEKIIIHENKLKAVIISAEMYDDYLKRLNTQATAGSKTIASNSTNSNNNDQTLTKNGISPFSYDYNATLNDIARDAFDYLETNQLLTDDHLYNLCNGIYCKDMFNLSYPLLKRIHNKILLSTEIVIDSQVRYWKQVYTFNNKFYVLYSLLYDKQKHLFVDWMDRYFNQ